MKQYLNIICLTITLLATSNAVVYADTYINGNIGGDTNSGHFVGAVNAGYNFNNYVGLEGGVTASGKGYGIIDGAVKGTLPLSQIFSLYGRAGIGGNLYYPNNTSRPISTDVGLLLGLGAKFNLSRNLALTVENYGVTSGPDFLLAGMEVKF